ncbi:hypothetical protein Ddc_18965 [Ditylenchus destructor]|nr:hypothetical protein Ddc_18965 [Ditylenchus destructor]
MKGSGIGCRRGAAIRSHEQAECPAPALPRWDPPGRAQHAARSSHLLRDPCRVVLPGMRDPVLVERVFHPQQPGDAGAAAIDHAQRGRASCGPPDLAALQQGLRLEAMLAQRLSEQQSLGQGRGGVGAPRTFAPASRQLPFGGQGRSRRRRIDGLAREGRRGGHRQEGRRRGRRGRRSPCLQQLRGVGEHHRNGRKRRRRAPGVLSDELIPFGNGLQQHRQQGLQARKQLLRGMHGKHRGVLGASLAPADLAQTSGVDVDVAMGNRQRSPERRQTRLFKARFQILRPRAMQHGQRRRIVRIGSVDRQGGHACERLHGAQARLQRPLGHRGGGHADPTLVIGAKAAPVSAQGPDQPLGQQRELRFLRRHRAALADTRQIHGVDQHAGDAVQHRQRGDGQAQVDADVVQQLAMQDGGQHRMLRPLPIRTRRAPRGQGKEAVDRVPVGIAHRARAGAVQGAVDILKGPAQIRRMRLPPRAALRQLGMETMRVLRVDAQLTVGAVSLNSTVQIVLDRLCQPQLGRADLGLRRLRTVLSGSRFRPVLDVGLRQPTHPARGRLVEGSPVTPQDERVMRMLELSEAAGRGRPQPRGGSQALRLLGRLVQRPAESLFERGPPRGLDNETALHIRQRQRGDPVTGRASGAGGGRCARRGGRGGAGLERMDGHG